MKSFTQVVNVSRPEFGSSWGQTWRKLRYEKFLSSLAKSKGPNVAQVGVKLGASGGMISFSQVWQSLKARMGPKSIGTQNRRKLNYEIVYYDTRPES